MYEIFKHYIQIFFLNACYFSSACCCVWDALRLAGVWMSITFQLAGFSLHLFSFTPELLFQFPAQLPGFHLLLNHLFAAVFLLAPDRWLRLAHGSSHGISDTSEVVSCYFLFENLPFGIAIDMG